MLSETEKECLTTIGQIAAVLEMTHLTDKEKLERIQGEVIKYVMVEIENMCEV